MPRYQINKDGTRAVVVMQGDLTAALVPELKTVLKQLRDEGVTELVFDLGQTGVVDSSGIGLLIAAHNSLTKNGGKLKVVGVSKEISTLFTAMRLDQHFAIEGAVEGHA